ncbi:MAG TPA: transketolase family protein [Bacillota bacterium]|nr:transketolase family protein [Bacillota bacterium]HOH09990.1 transketolase family protein [Bacillota bacterium]HOY88747.1 transketolase family protein [Bacillota bacterium]HPI01270.1 transketolase family protein [Bacillota bacterium]HPM63303.1 transketolase family protein [Bacillota bacterium]
MEIVELKVNLASPERVPSRDGYGHGLVDAGKMDENVVALGADITASVRVDWFQKEFPERFFSVGIAEQDQMCIAAGLALMGKVPFVTNYGVFLAGRAWDQIRTTVCYSNLNVKLGGAHGGISVGADGATHQALEEIALMRCLPNMKVIVPADAIEARKATVAIAKTYGPAYVRFGREKVPVVTDEATPFEIGKAYCCKDGTDVAIVACGAMVYEALVAAEKLAKSGISAMVINNHTVKPIDKDTLIEAAKKTKAVVTAEEHQLMGGMGSAVLEVLAQNYPVPARMVGVEDRFGESGDPDTLMKAFGLTSDHIVEVAKEVLKMKMAR